MANGKPPFEVPEGYEGIIIPAKEPQKSNFERITAARIEVDINEQGQLVMTFESEDREVNIAIGSAIVWYFTHGPEERKPERTISRSPMEMKEHAKKGGEYSQKITQANPWMDDDAQLVSPGKKEIVIPWLGKEDIASIEEGVSEIRHQASMNLK